MSISQTHGNQIQNWFSYELGTTNLFGGGFDFARDPLSGLPVLFKTHKKETKSIWLSGAVPFLRLLQGSAFLLIDARYDQIGDIKSVVHVDEYVVQPHHAAFLRDGLDIDAVIDMENKIKDRSIFPPGEEKRASALVQEWRTQFKVLQINPKLDSKKQRRLQISLPDASVVRTESFQYSRHLGSFRGLPLPAFRSTQREFAKKA